MEQRNENKTELKMIKMDYTSILQINLFFCNPADFF